MWMRPIECGTDWLAGYMPGHAEGGVVFTLWQRNSALLSHTGWLLCFNCTPIAAPRLMN